MLVTIIIIAIGLTGLSLIATIIWLLKVSGLFSSVKIKIAQPSFEFLTIAYKYEQGDYSKSADIFRDILNFSPGHSTLAIYYDNPDDVGHIRLISYLIILFFYRRHQLNNDDLSLELLLMRKKMRKSSKK